jgi:hypothetical protein
MKAFPNTFEKLLAIKEDKVQKATVVHEGMDLRDYFAAKAMHAMIASGKLPTGIMIDTAEEAYLMADIMMKARKK